MGHKIEPRLQQLLNAEEVTADAIDVVVRFNLPTIDPARSGSLMQRRDALARSMTSTIESALARAQDSVGEQPASVSLFPSVGSLYVQATRPFLRALLEQDQVQGATLNSSTPKEQ